MLKMTPEKDPDNAQWLVNILPFIYMVTLASFGGAIRYFQSMKKSGKAFNFMFFVIEILTSAFVGIIAFELCAQANLSWNWTAVICGISGHLGTTALSYLSRPILDNFLKGIGYERKR